MRVEIRDKTHLRQHKCLHICFMKETLMHNSVGPSLFIMKNEHLYIQQYHLNGILHRNGGPAQIVYELPETIPNASVLMRLSGGRTTYSWYIDGKLHNGNEPAFICEYLVKPAANVKYWYINGERFGPIGMVDGKLKWVPNYDASRRELASIADWISKQAGDWNNPTPEMMALFKLTWCR